MNFKLDQIRRDDVNVQIAINHITHLLTTGRIRTAQLSLQGYCEANPHLAATLRDSLSIPITR